MTITQMLDTYQASRLTQVKNPQSIRYAVTILKAAFGAVRADKLTAEQIDRERQRMREKGRQNGTGYAGGSVDRIFRVFRAAFNLALRDRKLTWAPRIDMYNPEDSRQVFYEADQAEAIRLAFASFDTDMEDLWTFEYNSGRRPRELQTAAWSYLSWPERTLRIPRSKSRRPWILVLKGPLYEVIQRRYHKRRPPLDLIFHRDGKPIDDSTRNRLFGKARLMAELPPTFRWRDTRQTVTRDMSNAGVPRTVIKRHVGIVTDNIFERYCIHDIRDLDAGMDQLLEFRQSQQALPSSPLLSTLPIQE